MRRTLAYLAGAVILTLAMASNALASGAHCKVSDNHKSYSSLGSAVSAASSGDTLVVSGNCASTSEILINGLTLTIKGRGKKPTISLAGGSTGRVLGVFPSADVTIDGLTITGGNGTADGGGLDNFGTVVLNDSTVTGNSVTAGGNAACVGGGIFNEEGGTLTLNSSTVSNNAALASSGQQASGGGIFDASGGTTTTAGTVTLNNSTVSGNTTGGASTPGGTPANYGFGGGIYVTGTGFGAVPGSVTLTGTTTVTGNTATGTVRALGGGVFEESGANLVGASSTNVFGNTPDDIYQS
jgi:hypothetical protein